MATKLSTMASTQPSTWQQAYKCLQMGHSIIKLCFREISTYCTRVHILSSRLHTNQPELFLLLLITSSTILWFPRWYNNCILSHLEPMQLNLTAKLLSIIGNSITRRFNGHHCAFNATCLPPQLYHGALPWCILQRNHNFPAVPSNCFTSAQPILNEISAILFYIYINPQDITYIKCVNKWA